MTLAGLEELLVVGAAVAGVVVACLTLAHHRRVRFETNLPRLQFDGEAILLVHIWALTDPDPHADATRYLRLSGVVRNTGATPANNVRAIATSESELGYLSLRAVNPGEELRLDGSEASSIFVKPTHPTQRLGSTELRLLYSNPAGEQFESVYTSLEEGRFLQEVTGPLGRATKRGREYAG